MTVEKRKIHEWWLLVGHLLISFGSCCLALGSILKAESGGELPTRPITNGEPPSTSPQSIIKARDYFL